MNRCSSRFCPLGKAYKAIAYKMITSFNGNNRDTDTEASSTQTDEMWFLSFQFHSNTTQVSKIEILIL